MYLISSKQPSRCFDFIRPAELRMTSTANNQGFWGLAIPRFIAVVIHKRELKAEGRAETVERVFCYGQRDLFFAFVYWN